MTSRKGTNKIDPKNIFAEHTLEVHATVEKLRKIVMQTVPNAVQLAYPVWHGIGFHHPESGYFCGIFPQKDSVKLGFEFGVLLTDPQSVLEGAGKQVRYVIAKDGKDIRADVIKKLLLAAISLPQGREVKVGLIRDSKP